MNNTPKSILAGGTIRAGRFVAPGPYTHLRAHETDSYLVCRLLLEKKKKKIKKILLMCLRTQPVSDTHIIAH